MWQWTGALGLVRQGMVAVVMLAFATFAAPVSDSVAEQHEAVDALETAFSEVARPVGRFTLSGCSPAPHNPIANDGASLVVRCSGALRLLHVQDLLNGESDGASAPSLEYPRCPEPRGFAPPTMHVDGPRGSVVFLCEGRATQTAQGLQLPIFVSKDWAPSSQLIVANDGATTSLQDAQFHPARGMNVSDVGNLMVVTADIEGERVAVVIDVERRTLHRVLHASNLPFAGMSSGYRDFRSAMFARNSTTVIASVDRESGRPPYRVNTLVRWEEDGTITGIDLMEHVDLPIRVSGAFARSGGLIPVGVQWQVFRDGIEAPVNQLHGFRTFAFSRSPQRSERSYLDPAWLDPRDMWFGDNAQAQTRYAQEAGPIHCEVQAHGRQLNRVVLARAWAIRPFAARLFADEPYVNCAIDAVSETLVVWGSSGVVQVYALHAN
ncbi:hypothetical protein [Vitreimonas flagellata]|uniref:hypothetical protein n=1 Tax=Vitreimonas flagellata TaxID=2560861 RepID=UPI001074A0F4|nr:hypothetical protein [Vitreimonas flagellata]